MKLVSKECSIVQLVLGDSCSADVNVLEIEDVSVWFRGILIKNTIPENKVKKIAVLQYKITYVP